MFRNLLSGSMDFAEVVVYILSTLAVVFLTLPIHEWAHAFTAVKLGDDTPRWQGRLSINPFAHIDWIGAALIVLFGFGWAKPVQIDARNFKKPKRDMAITALAGPLANILMALILMIILNAMTLLLVMTDNSIIVYIFSFLYYIVQINIGLAVFNLIPIPPLDGSRLLSALLPDRYYYKLMRYEKYIFWVLIVMLYLGVLNAPLDFLTTYLYRGISFLARLPFELLRII